MEVTALTNNFSNPMPGIQVKGSQNSIDLSAAVKNNEHNVERNELMDLEELQEFLFMLIGSRGLEKPKSATGRNLNMLA